jgi:hypothetical protein
MSGSFVLVIIPRRKRKLQLLPAASPHHAKAGAFAYAVFFGKRTVEKSRSRTRTI